MSPKIYYPFPTIPVIDNNIIIHHQSTSPYDSDLFHETINCNFSIYNAVLLIHEKTDISFSLDNELIGLWFTLNSNMPYKIKGLCPEVIPENQFNMVYIPRGQECLYEFTQIGVYSIFFLNLSRTYLQGIKNQFSLLTSFINKLENKLQVSLLEENMHTAPEMSVLIHDILYNNYNGRYREIFMETKIRELLTLSLLKMSSKKETPNKITLRKHDIEKIQKVKEYLSQNVDTNYSLRELALMVGTNEFKLKNGFKKLFNTTVFGFLLEERMKKAEELLKDTEMPITEVAYHVGYKNLSNFTAVFKKIHGYPPSHVRSKYNND